MFWKRRAASKQAKLRFEHILMIANRLPVAALPDLLRAIVKPTQSDFLLAVAEDGTDARPNLDEGWFFFKGISQVLDLERMSKAEKDRNQYPLSLATDVVLPGRGKQAGTLII